MAVPIIEDFLSDYIQSKLDYLKNNPGYISKVIYTTPDKLTDLTSVLSGTIYVRKAFPRDYSRTPCICIILDDEGESQNGLGDTSMDDEEGNDSYSSTREDTIKISSLPDEDIPIIGTHVFEVSIPMKPIEEISFVSSISDATTGATMDVSDYEIIDARLGKIKLYSVDLEDGDEVNVSYTYSSSYDEGLSTQFEINYKIEVWTNNADTTSQLYQVLKWCLLSSRDTMVTDVGLYRQRISGADIQQDVQYAPDFIYRRALNFWAQVDISVPNRTGQYITDINVNANFYNKGDEINGE